MTMRSWIRNLFARPATRTVRKAPCRARLSLEALEDRAVPATLTPLASFNGTNGACPGWGLIRDSQGNFFGTTYKRGQSYGSGFDGNGYGMVFEVAAGSNTSTTLAAFNGTNGSDPWSVW